MLVHTTQRYEGAGVFRLATLVLRNALYLFHHRPRPILFFYAIVRLAIVQNEAAGVS